VSDELKVTVVATGLGSAESRARLQVVETQRAARSEEPQAEVDLAAEPDYRDYDRPPARRSAARGSAAAATAEKLGEDYFDIPAFLRRQAD
jgi:cell division protein FtsZ